MGTVLANNDRRLERVSFLETLFSNPRAALLWLPVRIWLGWQWVEAASHKTSNPAWVETGAALKGFWTGAVAIPETGRPAIAFDWYRGFIQAMLDADLMHAVNGYEAAAPYLEQSDDPSVVVISSVSANLAEFSLQLINGSNNSIFVAKIRSVD